MIINYLRNYLVKYIRYFPFLFVYFFFESQEYLNINGLYLGNIFYCCILLFTVFTLVFSASLSSSSKHINKYYNFYLFLFSTLYLFCSISPHGFFAIYNPNLVLLFIIFGEFFSFYLLSILNNFTINLKKEIIFFVFFSLILLYLLIPNFDINIYSNSFDELHVQSYISSIINMLNSKNPDYIENQYGNYFLFFYALSYFINLNIENIFTILLLLQYFIYTLIYLALRNRSKNFIFPMLIVGACFYLIDIYRVGLDSYYYYQHYPHRILAPVLVLFLIEFKTKIKYFLIYFLVLITILILFWNIETAVLSFLSYLVCILISLNTNTNTNEFNSNLVIFKKYYIKFKYSLLCSIFLLLTFILLIVNHFFYSKVYLYFQYLNHFLLRRALYGTIEFSAISIFALISIWFLLSWKQHHDFFKIKKIKNHSLYFCCVYSLLFSIYWFLNGSWIISIDFAVYVFIAFGFFINEFDIKKSFDNIIAKIGVKIIIVMFLFFIYQTILLNKPKITNPNEVMLRNISSVILSYTQKDEEVLILTDRNYLYTNNNLRIPDRFTSLTEMINNDQLNNYILLLKNVNKVIIDPLPAYNRGIGIYKNKIKEKVLQDFVCTIKQYEVEVCIREKSLN